MVSVGAVVTPPSNSSLLDQTTYKDDEDRVPVKQTFQLEEIVIIFIIVIFWLVAVMAFLKKWDSIRIMQPMEHRYKHSPKNLENIKIVKRPQDSVIYKNYSRKMSTTMVARENRRLQRMHTVPCMGALPSLGIDKNAHKLPTIHMEETTEI